jgi:hypothetical protein
MNVNMTFLYYGNGVNPVPQIYSYAEKNSLAIFLENDWELLAVPHTDPSEYDF